MALRQVYDDNGTLKSKDIAGSGSANAADTAYDNSTTGLPARVQGAIDKTTGNISSLGTVELTATAAHAHAAGSTFLWIGQLVKATAAIAVGDTITVGTNVENTDICSVLDELKNNKQNKTDNTLMTTSKTVVGAINEVNNKFFFIGGSRSTIDYGTVNAGCYLIVSLQWLEYHGVWLLLSSSQGGAAFTQIMGGSSVTNKVPAYTRNGSVVTIDWTNVYNGYPGDIVHYFVRLT